MSKADIGLIGLGVMGRNLALNMEEKGFAVAVWNLEQDVTEKFLKENSGKAFSGCGSFEELAGALKSPRKVFLMIPAGKPVDDVLEKLIPLLSEGDIVMDGGNSHFKDTERRVEAASKKGVFFLGVGVSGGEEGARKGPSLMPGGNPKGFGAVQNLLEAVSAKTSSGPCTAWMGPGGAGHFVKMVHNGIEYADMQLLAESYDLMRKLFTFDALKCAEVFEKWNEGPLESFLVELTVKVLRKKDAQTGGFLVDRILDSAGQKGTGRWSVEAALEAGESVSMIAAALDARGLSSFKNERLRLSMLLPSPQGSGKSLNAEAFLNDLEKALFAAKVTAYAQGFRMLWRASKEKNWNLPLSECARIWKGGCIIRAKVLDRIERAFEKERDLPLLLASENFTEVWRENLPAWRRVVQAGAEGGVPLPAFSSGLCWWDAWRSVDLPQNLTQAQRDAFGAHTYQRKDDPSGRFYHTDWSL